MNDPASVRLLPFITNQCWCVHSLITGTGWAFHWCYSIDLQQSSQRWKFVISSGAEERQKKSLENWIEDEKGDVHKLGSGFQLLQRKRIARSQVWGGEEWWHWLSRGERERERYRVWCRVRNWLLLHHESVNYHERSILGSSSELESDFKMINLYSEKQVVVQEVRTPVIFIGLRMRIEARHIDLIVLPFFTTVI
jgi:hypothetical protein